ncbi:hypothetical protein [Pseudomonas sp. PMCC200344]|uniref:hypothetical protein n=1 Tax=Pseudomonas sp. PMCC200344 TaxID=3042028 RepID=UPI0024B39321|nr:hypothetical protein [Pseudomonas sp. PMCC200344]
MNATQSVGARLARDECTAVSQAHRIIVHRGQALRLQKHRKIIDPEQFPDQENTVKRRRSLLAVTHI